MRTMQEVLSGLIKLGLLAVGVLYAIQILKTYARARAGEPHWPPLDWKEPIRSAEQVLIWGGVFVVAVGVRLVRPLVDTLSEASAEVGEWAMNRHQTEATVRTRTR
ncbi:MAG TPA: hypothetical protein VMT20_08035 [Terriglobia bacterium]|nr:hypothetical protein [Terriglobia bacterium]